MTKLGIIFAAGGFVFALSFGAMANDLSSSPHAGYFLDDNQRYVPALPGAAEQLAIAPTAMERLAVTKRSLFGYRAVRPGEPNQLLFWDGDSHSYEPANPMAW